jgi:hypothetical protein
MSATCSLPARLQKLSDPALIESTKSAVRKERNATTVVLHHFIEVENRRLYANRHSSLFAWAREELRYTEGAAQRRIDSSRLLRRHPYLEQQIENGRISLTQLSYARHFFRQEKKHGSPYSLEQEREVLTALEGKSTRKTLRFLMERSSAPEKLDPKSGARPMKNGKTELRLILDEETMNDLTRIKELWSHAVPDGDWAEIIARMANVTLEKIHPMKKAERAVQRKEKRSTPAQEATPAKPHQDLTARKSAASTAASTPPTSASVNFPTGASASAGGTTLVLPRKLTTDIVEDIAPVKGERKICLPHLGHTRYIPASVKQAVWLRDGGRCAYADSTGKRCESRHQLEYDHRIPFALGGDNSPSNIRLLCRSHNSLMADRAFGRRLMTNRSQRESAVK